MEWRGLLQRLRRRPGEGVPLAPPPSTPPPSADAARGEPAWVQAYRSWVIESLGTVRILDMTDPLTLDQLYIPVDLTTPSNRGPHADALEQRFVDIDDQARMDADWRRGTGTVSGGAEGALVERGRVALIGDAGAGKTTMLRHLALRLAAKRSTALPPLPLVVDLHALGQSRSLDTVAPERVFVAWIAEQIERSIPGAAHTEPWLDEQLARGAAVLLLDGLDEVTGAAEEEAGPYRAVARALGSLATTYPHAPVLFTCRRAHVEQFVSIPKGFQVLETCDFEWEHVARFVDVWFRRMPETGEALKAQLQRNVRIRGLAANPLLLALICIIFQRRGSLPQRRADVYRRCVDVLLAEWDATRRRDRFPRFTLEHKEDLLRRIAWHYHERGERYMRQQDLIDLIASFLPMIRLPADDARPILDEISAHHGLLKDFGQGWYGFHHFTLQEHFAVEQITSWRRLDAAISLRRRNWWREVIRLYAGKGDCTELVCRLAREREDLFQTNLFLAAECLTEGGAVEPELLRHVREELARISRHQSRPAETRTGAAELAMRLVVDDDYAPLERLVADERVLVSGRINMARHIAHGRSPDTLMALGHLIASTSLDVAVRDALATSLAAELGPTRFDVLVDHVARDADPSARRRLSVAIGRGLADHPEALLQVVVREDMDAAIRQGLAVAMGYSNRSDVLAVLQQAKQTVRQDEMRWPVRIAAVRAGDTGALKTMPDAIMNGKLDTWVRTEAAAAYSLRDRRAAGKLLWEVVGDRTQERTLRAHAARLLGGMATEPLAAGLLELARDESADRFVRVAILEGLGENRSVQLIDRLLEMLGDAGLLEYVKRAVVDALGVIGDPAAVPALAGLWGNGSPTSRLGARAALALGRLGAVPALLEAVKILGNLNVDKVLRRSLADALQPSGTAIDSAVLDQLCMWLPGTDTPGALLTVIARFATETGRSICPEDIGLKPIRYSWAEPGACAGVVY